MLQNNHRLKFFSQSVPTFFFIDLLSVRGPQYKFTKPTYSKNVRGFLQREKEYYLAKPRNFQTCSTVKQSFSLYKKEQIETADSIEEKIFTMVFSFVISTKQITVHKLEEVFSKTNLE